MGDQVDFQLMVKAIGLIEAIYCGMPSEEYFDKYLDEALRGMSTEALEFFAAVTASSALALTIMTEEQRTKFFAVGATKE